MGVGQRALSLSAHTVGGPPPPGPREGGVTTPYSWSIAGTTVGLLLRGTGGFNHPRESLIPSLHTGGPRRGRSFRRRLRRWCRWHADTRKHWLRPVGLATVIRQVSAFLKAWNWSLRPTRLTLDFDVPIATSTSLIYSMLNIVLLHVDNYTYAFRLDVKRDVSVAPGGVYL